MKPENQPVDQAAARWLARHEQGLSAAQEVEFARWLEADGRHVKSYRALEQSWSRLDRVRESRLSAQLEAELDDLPTPAVEASDLDRLRRAAHFRPQRWMCGALAAGLAWGVVYFAWWRPTQASAPYAETAATEVGVVRTVELPDGSIVRLNTNSALDVVFTAIERRVRLSRGEAFFTIARNSARPFIVSAAGVDIQAVGTEFNVRFHAEAIEVTVREGVVRVDDAANGESLLARSALALEVTGAPPILAAGQRVVIPVAAMPKLSGMPVTPVAVAPLEIERSLAWQNRRLVFESAPLSSMVEEFNRYNRRRLVIADHELATRRFGGTFEANDPKTFIDLLRTSYDVVAEERAGETVLRLRR